MLYLVQDLWEKRIIPNRREDAPRKKGDRMSQSLVVVVSRHKEGELQEPKWQARDPDPEKEAAQVRSLVFKMRTLWGFEKENDAVQFCLKSTLPAEWETDRWKMSDQEPCGYLWSNSRTWSGALQVGTWPESHLGTLQCGNHSATWQPGCQRLWPHFSPIMPTWLGHPTSLYLLSSYGT